MKSGTYNINIKTIIDERYTDEFEYTATFNMQPSTTSTVVNSIEASSLE